MHTHFAIISKTAYQGSLSECINWAEERIEAKKAKIVKIVIARPEDIKCQIIYEVDRAGVRACHSGRVIDLCLLKKAVKNGAT
ncbi:MAG: hypothetical protein CMH28_07150 [Micavibrio sp.]|nr:hypothetical protein [Micavibrio sp.]